MDFFLIRELLIVQNHWISHEGSEREGEREAIEWGMPTTTHVRFAD